MAKVLHHKVVVALPSPLEPDSIYYVRAGDGFDIHVTNGAGVVKAYSLNASLGLEGKVDKELGYSLLPNTEITRLATMSTGATKNRADSENADKEHTHTTDSITDMSASGKAVATGTPAQGRAGLGLGTVATEDVGTSVGNVMEVGAFGLGSKNVSNRVPELTSYATHPPAGFYRTSATEDQPAEIIGNNWSVLVLNSFTGRTTFLSIGDPAHSSRWSNIVLSSLWEDGLRSTIILTGSNTTIDSDGFIKSASPILNLYTDKHELHSESQFGATPTVVRKSKGVHEITGTLGLRSEGWYLDTPSDRNGNKYFNIEWTQNITPDAVDGVVDEYRDDIVVTIETFERVWNKDTGMFENGAPIDINDLQDRFVQLRFNEIKIEHEEMMDDSN